MLKLRILLPLIIVSLLIMTFAVTAQELAEEQILRAAVPVRSINSMDPAYATLTGEKEFVAQLTNGLLTFPHGHVGLETIEGDLAKSWDVSDDGLTWTFYLREGIQFHRGYGELTAEDVKFTFERILEPDSGSPWRAKYSIIETIEVIDDYTVKITLNTLDPFFELKLIGYHGGQIVSKKAVEELGDDFSFHPIGTGPFMLESYESGESIVMVPNENYFKGQPILERLEYIFMPDDSSRLMALERGEVDIGRGIVDRAWMDQAIQRGLVAVPPHPAQQLILMFNMNREPLDNILVRQAIAHAINTQDIIDLFGDILGGEMVGPLPPGYFGQTEEGLASYPYDPDKAKSLLAEAGYPNGLSLGRTFVSESFSYLVPMEIIQEHLRLVGVEINLEVVDHPTFHARIREDLNPLIIYGGVREPVADSILTEFYHSRSIVQTPTAVTNFAHYDGIDELLDEARSTLDRDLQLKNYALAQQKIMEDLASLPLCLFHQALVRQEWVDLGYNTDPYETLYYLIEVSENTRILKR